MIHHFLLKSWRSPGLIRPHYVARTLWDLRPNADFHEYEKSIYGFSLDWKNRGGSSIFEVREISGIGPIPTAEAFDRRLDLEAGNVFIFGCDKVGFVKICGCFPLQLLIGARGRDRSGKNNGFLRSHLELGVP